jgi:uncharacterized membrane protein (DUF4010 family)
VAILGGLAIGLERQRAGHATGPLAHLGGIRTFTLFGAAGGLAGWLSSQGLQILAGVILAVAGGLVVVGYRATSRKDIDATTEVAAVVVLGAAVLAGLGYAALASAIFATTAVVLAEKSRIHSFVARLDDEELRAAALFGVMAVVVLPLLPEGPIGPGIGIRPRNLWMLVLFFSGLSFVGYIARKAVGEQYGYPLAGLLGGLVSSTNVTWSFSRASRARGQSPFGLAYGVVAASTMLNIRLALTIAALNPSLVMVMWRYLVPPSVVGVLVLILGVRHMHQERDGIDVPKNPLQVVAALQMAFIFQVVLFAIDFIRRWVGEPGVIASGVVLGLTDMDALTISMAQGAAGPMPIDVAARAIAAGLLSNTVLKAAIAGVIGRGRFRAIAVAALLTMAATIGAGMGLGF